MEILNFVHNVSWNRITSQHKGNNWEVEVSLYLPVPPISWFIKALVYIGLHRLCTDWSAKHWWSRSSVRQEHTRKYQRALRDHNLLELEQVVKRAMPHLQNSPEMILYLQRGLGFPDCHPVFCVRSRGVRRALLITAFSSLNQCHQFLRVLMHQKLVSLFGENIIIRSLVPIEHVQRTGGSRKLKKEEWKKVLRTHHPCFICLDPITRNESLGYIRQLAPKLQGVLLILWVLCCCVFSQLSASKWQSVRIPFIVGTVAVFLDFTAAVLSMSALVKRRVVLRADWLDIDEVISA